MRCLISLALLLGWGASLVLAADEAPTTQPAAVTQPAATQPATGTIRGQVEIEGGSIFQSPDLSRVVVYLASDSLLDRLAGPTTRAIVSQRNKSFIPNFIVIPRGTEVEFPNWDRFDH